MMRDESSDRFKFFPRLSPFAVASVLIFIVVSWLVFSNEARRRQQHLEQRSAQLPTWPAPPITSEELLARMHTAPLTRSIVPLPSSGKRFFLYSSPNTSRYFSSSGTDYESVLAPWRSFFKKRQLPVVVVSNLNAIQRQPGSILVLPSAVALSSAEKRDLVAFQQHGGSILATGALGLRDNNGSFKGYGFLKRLFDIGVSGEIGPDDKDQFLNLSGDTPVTSGYSAGQRIWLENRTEKFLRLSGGRQAGFYTEWARKTATGAHTAAVTYGEHGAARNHARWVVLGFPESSWSAEPEQLDGLLENSLHWLARGVVVTKETWPALYRAAYVVEMDTEEGFKNAEKLARMMDDIGKSATFYCITAEALLNPELTRELGKRHEIAFHGDLHNSFRGMSETAQSGRFDRMQKEMSEILGQSVRLAGFRAPMEEYNKSTERILQTKAFGHHAVDPNRTDATLPFFYQADDSVRADSLVIIPRTQRDDFTLPVAGEGKDAEKLLRSAMVADFDNAVQMGSLGFLSIHSQHFGPDSLLAAVMPEFLEHAARYRPQVWITSSSQIAQWWRERERLEYSIKGVSGKFTITATITGLQPLDRGSLVITNSQSGVPVRIRALKPGSPVANVKPIDELRSAIVFDGMAPGRYSFEVASGPLPRSPAVSLK
ncbi:MAG: polysaccharide deacetylase family protein [Burkholderiaceae bacterium]